MATMQGFPILRNLFFYLALWPLAALFSCSSTVHDSHIPANARQVVTLNSRSLVFKEFDLSAVLKILGNLGEVDTTRESAELKQKVKESGIDLISNAYIYTLNPGGSGQSTIHAIVALDNRPEFEEFLKSLDKMGRFYEAKGLKMFKGENFLVGFTDEMALMASAEVPDFKRLEQEVMASFLLPENQNLITLEPTFKNQLKKDFEIAFWARVSSLANDNSLQSFLSEELIPGGKITAEMTFEEGKVDLQMALNWDSSKGALIQDFISQPISKDLLKIGPIENPVGIAGIKINLELLYNMMAQAGSLRTADAYLSLMGSSSKEISECFTGDAAITLTEVYEKNKPEFLLSAKIKDEKSWSHFMGKMVGQALLTKEGSYFSSGFLPSDYSLIEADGMVYIATTESLRNQILEKKNETLNPQIASLSGNSAMMIYLNPSLFASQQLGLITPKTGDFCRKLKGVSIGMIEQSPGLISGFAELQLAEQKENSLQTLLRFTQEVFNPGKGKFEVVQDSAKVGLDLEQVLP